MKLAERKSGSNIYDMGNGLRRSVLGGIPNVLKNIGGNLVPLDNSLVIKSHPIVKYLVKQGPFEIGFHKKSTNKYMSAVRLRTGETLVKTAIGDVACTPVIEDNRTIKWLYPNGSWIKEYATEKHIKETMFQKKGQLIRFKYVLNGLTAKNGGDRFDIYKGDKKAFSIQKPYYMTEDGEFISWVPISWAKEGDNWVVTYPAPDKESYIDPTIVFGVNAGQTLGLGHKDTYVYSAGNAVCQGDSVILSLRLTVRIPLIRFDLSTIPANAIVNSAILTTVTAVNGVGGNVAINRLLTSWGITDFNAGVLANPEITGGATWRRPRDFNGAGGDVPWAVGITFSAADYFAVAEDTQVLAAAGMVNNHDATNSTQDFINGTHTNNGWTYQSAINNNDSLNSFEAIIIASRPHLTVDYTIPVSGIFNSRKMSRANLINGISM